MNAERADQPRGLEHARRAGGPSTRTTSTPARAARLERAHAVEREAAVGAAQQRRSGAEQRPVEIDVEAAQRVATVDRARHTGAAVSIVPKQNRGRLLEAGRSDERLVHDDVYGARSARLVSVPAELGPAVRSRAGAASGSRLCTPIRRRRC